MTNDAVTAPQPATAQTGPEDSRRPTRVLPTNRISFAKQLDLVRAYDAASGMNSRPVTLGEVGKIVKMEAATISLANPFLTDVGLVVKGDDGKFTPSPTAHEFALAHSWSPETAAIKLAPRVRQAWFFQALEPRLSYSRTITEEEALRVLAEAAEAGPKYRPQLQLLLNYLEAADLIVRDGGNVGMGTAAGEAATPAAPTAPTAAQDHPQAERSPPARERSPAVSTTFAQQPEGLVQFAVSVRVDMSELRGWSPDRIASFFAGIAQVLAAKGSVEAETTGED